MNRSTLPRHALRTALTGWAHPYPGGPMSPVFYSDGGDGDGDGDGDGEPDPKDGEGDGDGDGDEPDPDGDDVDEPDPDGADDLGDKGKKALDAMKAKLRAERTRRRTAESERDQLKTAKPGDGDDADRIRAEAEQAALTRANSRIVRSEVRAAAAGKLTDPKDALTFIDLDQFEVDEDGQVDEDEVADAIDDLLKAKPYLAAATAKRFQGTGDGGAARKAGRPKQLTRADLKNMSPEEIDKASSEGRLDDLMSGKQP